MDNGLKGYFAGSLLTFLVMTFWIDYYDLSKSDLKNECEKDLARNLKCTMVYVKPSIEGE